MISDIVIKSLYELMLPESADEKRAYAELVIRELDALRERAEKAESECKTLSDILAKDTMDALGAIRRAKKAEAMVERMIEHVDKVKNTLSNYFRLFHAPNVGSFLDDWNALVAEWEERK